MNIQTKHIALTLLITFGFGSNLSAVENSAEVERYVKPSVQAINNKLKTPLPDISFIQHQEIEIKKGKLISKKALLSGVRIEEVKLSDIDVNNITISKSLGQSYYFVTIFCENDKQDVSYGYQPTEGSDESSLAGYNLKSLEHKGQLNHFCLSVNSLEDAKEIVKMIKALAANS